MTLKYSRFLQAIKIQAKRNGITAVASNSLNKILQLSHPSRELAFLDWALNTQLYKQPAESRLRHEKFLT